MDNPAIVLSARGGAVDGRSCGHSKGYPAAQGTRVSLLGIPLGAEYLVRLALKYRPIEVFLANTPE